MANVTMADLMNSLDKKPLTVQRGDKATGTVVLITPQDVILDLGTKTEGVLSKKELSEAEAEKVKVGDKLTVFVGNFDRESGQLEVFMGEQSSSSSPSSLGNKGPNLSRFDSALRNKSILKGRGLEVNKGGVLVEVDRFRGFLPSSQINFSKVANAGELVGKDLELRVIEVDASSNRVIFSQKGTISDETKKKLANYKTGDEVTSKVISVLPFGLFVDLEGLEGFVHVSDIAWERVENLEELYNPGDEIKAQVTGLDEEMGRVNLSVKATAPDPFQDYAKNHQAEDVVSGTITHASESEVKVALGEGIEGTLPQDKFESGVKYEVGQKLQFLIDSIDERRRKISLSPLLTSTEGLMYR